MAARGLDHDLRKKREASYDKEMEGQIRDWIEAVTGESVSGEFADALHDGQILCKLANALAPGSVSKVSTSGLAFKQMENIGKFLEACSAIGVATPSLFQTVDLYESSNLNQVLVCLQALSRAAVAAGFSGPALSINKPTMLE